MKENGEKLLLNKLCLALMRGKFLVTTTMWLHGLGIRW